MERDGLTFLAFRRKELKGSGGDPLQGREEMIVVERIKGSDGKR